MVDIMRQYLIYIAYSMEMENTGELVKQPIISVPTTIRIMGHFLSSSLVHQKHEPYSEISFQSCMKSYRGESNNDEVNPRKIYAEGNMIIVLDDNQNLWMISGIFKNSINVSTYTKKKFRSVFISEKECIAKAKKSDILINWGAKKLFANEELEAIPASVKSNDYFKAFQILDKAEKNNKYYFTTMKKSQNSNKLYKIDEETIYGYPTAQKIQMKEKIVGISAGKFHCMCWDILGKLYTWGNKSIALGYKELPQDKIIYQPQQVTSMKGFVTSAFAATHYSLALNSQGIIYEWGIKKQINEINEELIFEPTPIVVKENGKNKKFVMLKGKYDAFAGLTTNSQLYVWGEGATKLLPKNIQTESWMNNRLFEPFKVPYIEDYKILDYCIEEKFLAFITAPLSSNLKMEEEKLYWDEMLKRIQKKISLGKKLKTQTSQKKGKQILTQRKSEMSVSSNQKKYKTMFDNIKSHFQYQNWQRQLKKQYFQLTKNETNFFKYIMGPPDQKSMMKMSIGKRTKKREVHITINKAFKSSRENWISNENETEKNLESMKKYINLTLSQNGKRKRNNSKFLSNRINSIELIKKTPRDNKPYSERLKEVLNRKKSLDEVIMSSIERKVEENSLQYRSRRHEEIVKAKIFEKNKNILKQTIQSLLIKKYLIKMFCCPVDEARRLKIQQFAKNLKLQRIEKNLRKIFIKFRIKKNMKNLREGKFHSYVLLLFAFRKFIKRKRDEKSRYYKKIVTEALYNSFIRDKLRLGISKTNLNVRKLQKFRQWLARTKIQRLKCLKILWKNHLLSAIKIKIDCSDSLSLIRHPQNCTFESLYTQKMSSIPILKLENFLNKCPIFQLRFEYFQSIIYLFGKDKKEEKIIKKLKKKTKIKFSEGSPLTIYNQSSQNEILPYSLHYNSVLRPNAMELNIPENMKVSEKWINQERKILNNVLEKIIFEHERKKNQEKRKYDKKLAYFIKEKYETLSEKRWKCIIQYNQLKPTIKKRKKQKQLYRLFDLIGMTKTLNQDCLPEKYLMLEEALKRRDAPTPPNQFITFSFSDFKILFKEYYETLITKAKQMRKNYI